MKRISFDVQDCPYKHINLVLGCFCMKCIYYGSYSKDKRYLVCYYPVFENKIKLVKKIIGVYK